MDLYAAQQRTMKEFLELYNKITYHCFDKCVSNFNDARASGDEINCVDTCTNKFINFNQRHMMMFVEHQNKKQKLAAKAAAEAQALDSTPQPTQPPSPPTTGDTTPQNLSTSPVQGSSPLVQPAVLVEETSAKQAVPQNVCCHSDSRLTSPVMATKPEKLTSYSGKSIVDQFLDSGAAKLKIV